MKREKAVVDARRKRIEETVLQNPEVRVDELAEKLNVSRMTIRRDLDYLESMKLLIRVHGGAVAASGEEEELKMYRTMIAKFAARFVEDNDTLFINTSRNAIQILKFVERRNVTVITNNGKAINAERNHGTNVILTGGELRHPKDAMVGDFAIRSLEPVYAKKAFIGCSGISAENGMTTEIANEVNINAMMISHATQDVYVLADHTKIGVNSSFASCPIDMIKYLITDEKAPEEELEKIRERGVRVYQVGKNEGNLLSGTL
jgi:DeoR/GlpR family transcriptional regulator of sugar metabolism